MPVNDLEQGYMTAMFYAIQSGPGTQETGVGQFRPRSVSVSEAHPGIQVTYNARQRSFLFLTLYPVLMDTFQFIS